MIIEMFVTPGWFPIWDHWMFISWVEFFREYWNVHNSNVYILGWILISGYLMVITWVDFLYEIVEI